MFTHAPKNDLPQRANLLALNILLKEKFFNKLRTQEQLGYIVNTQVLSFGKVLHFGFRVQSSHKSAEYLEHRINDFLKELKDWSPTDE